MAISRLLIEKTFDAIWENWIRKDGERAAMKAVEHALNSGENKDELIKACEIYRLENIATDPEFTHKLSNFINGDHWRDSLEGASLEKLKQKHDEAIVVIQAWNDACHKHWCKSIDIESKVPMAMKALGDKSFRSEWRKALNKAKKIFKYEFRDGDSRQKIILSLRWFTTVSHDKHTVLRIMEGEYGHPIKEDSPSQTKKIMQQSEEERIRLAKEYEEVFGVPLEIVKKPQKETKKHEPSTKAKEIADQILKSVGSKGFADGAGNDDFELI